MKQAIIASVDLIALRLEVSEGTKIFTRTGKGLTMQDMIQDFRVALYSGDFQHAENLAVNQLALLGESSEWLNELGTLYAALGKMAESLQFFDRAVAADSQNLEAILNGAVLLAELGFYDEATARFEAARILEEGVPNSFDSDPSQQNIGKDTRNKIVTKQIGIAKIYKTLGMQEQAITETRRAIEVTQNSEAHLELAKLFLEKVDAEKALAELEKARQIAPRNPEIHVIAAQCHILLGNQNEAQNSLSKAELLDDNSCAGTALRLAYREH